MMDQMTARDAHACHELAGECRLLGADLDAWRTRLLDGLRVLVGARVVILSEMVNFGPGGGGPIRALATHRLGWADDGAERRWRDYAGSVPVERTPEFPYISRFTGERLTLSRDEIWGRETWYRSKTFNEIHRACGIDDYVMSVRGTSLPGRSLSVWVHGAVGGPGFALRERAMIGLLHDCICR